jgi:hypothetical protein
VASVLWTTEQLVHHLFPSTFLIDPFLPRSGIALAYAKRGVGKTHFALTLAACLTEGGILFGRYATHQGPVVLVQADMGAPIQQRRVRQTRRTYPLTHLYFAFPDFLSLPDLTASDSLIQLIRSVDPVCVIWDTLRQIHRMDMNSDETPAWIYGTARHLLPHAAHLFIHHDKKTIAEQEDLDQDESFRGSGAWLDHADVGIKLRGVGTGRLALDFTKVRTCEPLPSLALSLSTETMLLYALGEDVRPLIVGWRARHPRGTPEDLTVYLLNSFVAPPRTIAALVQQAYAEGRVDGPGRLEGRREPPGRYATPQQEAAG